jgi:hypothetical protein
VGASPGSRAGRATNKSYNDIRELEEIYRSKAKRGYNSRKGKREKNIGSRGCKNQNRRGIGGSSRAYIAEVIDRRIIGKDQ